MPTRAVLFDFDGTLADSFDAITASANHARGHFSLPPITRAEVSQVVGLGLDQFLQELIPGVPLGESVAVYREHHQTVFLSMTHLFPGVSDTMRELHDRNYQLAVCSNKRVEFTKQLVGRLGLGAIVRETLGPEDVARPKPDPAMLLEACRRLGIPPADTVYVGDMAVDVLTGKAAGITTWLVPGGASGREDPVAAGPDRVLRDFREVGELLE